MEYDAKYVKCPYYIENNSEYQIKHNQIRCEGVDGIGTICLVFNDKRQQFEHKKKYCYRLHECHECPVCKLLDEKWRDKP